MLDSLTAIGEMTPTYQDSFETGLGTIEILVLSPEGHGQTEHQNCGVTIQTSTQKVQVVSFMLRNEWLPKGMSFKSSKGWAVRIEKTATGQAASQIKIQLLNPNADTSWGPATGECLDAIEINDEISHLYIGTEDSDALWARAEEDDWMPKRFASELGLHRQKSIQFTEFINFGLRTNVPQLEVGERIYFHYLVAVNSNKLSQQHPNERDIAAWFAVDQTKRNLEEYFKEEYGS